MIRVFIADDHALVREGLRRLVKEEPHLEVVGEAEDASSLQRQLLTVEVDVLLLDLAMPGGAFPDLIHVLHQRFPSLRILVVSMYSELEHAGRALEAGAAGFVSKRRSAEELSRAIGRVYAGGTYVSSAPQGELSESTNPGAATALGRLSRREYEMLSRLARGESITAIGHALRLSPKTVSTYRGRVLRKLGLKTTADLIRFALQRQLP